MYVGVCFFKQKTAYEMRIRDWSSDVRSSDLLLGHGLCVHQRPDIGIVDAAADRQRRGLPGEAAAEFAVDGALNVEAVGAQAVLPGGGELRLQVRKCVVYGMCVLVLFDLVCSRIIILQSYIFFISFSFL